MIYGLILLISIVILTLGFFAERNKFKLLGNILYIAGSIGFYEASYRILENSHWSLYFIGICILGVAVSRTLKNNILLVSTIIVSIGYFDSITTKYFHYIPWWPLAAVKYIMHLFNIG